LTARNRARAIGDLFRARGWTDADGVLAAVAASHDDSPKGIRKVLTRSFLSLNDVRADQAVQAIRDALAALPVAPTHTSAFGAVLFMDIVDSTPRAADLGDERWSRTIEKLYAKARENIGDAGGRVVKTTGDGLLAVFPEPRSAIGAATRLAKIAKSLGLSTRAGLHITGMSRVEEFDIGGVGVNVAARVMALAPKGALATTAAVRDALHGDSFGFESMGKHDLKGVPGKWELFMVRTGETPGS
jgi:class 3 adenylate cyclase